MNGRNAAKAFQQSRGARFTESRARSEAQKAEQVAAGTRRELQVVAVEDVRDTDEVAVTAGGFEAVSDVDRSEWATADGKTFVKRFRES